MANAAEDWLAQQCRAIGNVSRGALLIKHGGEGATQVIRWPRGSNPDPVLFELAETAIASRVPQWRTVSEDAAGQPSRTLIACPLSAENLDGAVTIECEGDATNVRDDALRVLRTALVERGPRATDNNRHDLVQRRFEQQGVILSLLAELVEHDEFQASMLTLATHLAGAFDCQRVSIGFTEPARTKVVALSNNAELDDHARLTRDLAGLMSEAVAYGDRIGHPSVDDTMHDSLVHRDHALEHQIAAVCTVPLPAHGELIGAICFERSAKFDGETLDLIERIAILIAPILATKHFATRPLRHMLARALLTPLRQLLGPRHLGLKLSTCLVAMTFAIASFVEVPYRVSAVAALEASKKQALVAPVDGYVATAHKRAGDLVEPGTLIATLDRRDLELERAKLENELAKLGKEKRAALSNRERTQVRILESRAHKTQAELALVDQRLERSQITAPIGGVIISGDLNNALGSPVTRGQVLFEIAPLDQYRTLLSVDERDVARLAPGQTGQLILAGLTNQPIPLTVRNIVPVAKVVEGVNTFRVEAELSGDNSAGRPGMKGIAKVEVGERNLAWIWGHRTIDWLRLQWWRWGW